MNPIVSMLRSKNNSSSQQNSKSTESNGNILSEFAKFKKDMQGKDAKAIVDGLRASGRMSEQQYQQLLQKAKNIEAFLK